MAEQTFITPQPMPETAAAFDERWGAVNDIRKLQQLRVNLPEMRSEAREVYDFIVEAERRLIAPTLVEQEYGEGTATYDDELYQEWARLPGGILVGADHASDPVRKATGLREGADHGTAGLAAVIAKDMSTDLILPRGKQTGNSATTPDYAYKNEIKRTLDVRRSTGMLSLHGMRPGLVVDPLDTSEAHGLIGLGMYEPRPETLNAARYLQEKAQQDLGLRVLISNYDNHLLYEASPTRPSVGVTDKINKIKVDENGEPVRSRLAAMGQHSVANFVMRETDDSAPALPVFQLEISRSLRLTPEDIFVRDQRALEDGVYMGYLLSKLAVEGMENAR